MAKLLSLGSGTLRKYRKGELGIKLPDLTTHLVLDTSGGPRGYVIAQFGGYISWFDLTSHVLLFHGSYGSLTALLGMRRS